MREEIKKFSEIYDKGYTEENIYNDGYFILSGKNKRTYIMKQLYFINDNDFLNNLNDVFMFKSLVNETIFYTFFCTYKEVKIKVYYFGYGEIHLKIYNEDGEYCFPINLDLSKYNLNENELEFLEKNISMNIKNNTQERLKFLLNQVKSK